MVKVTYLIMALSQEFSYSTTNLIAHDTSRDEFLAVRLDILGDCKSSGANDSRLL